MSIRPIETHIETTGQGSISPSLDTMPIELIQRIISFLPSSTELKLVSRSFKEIVESSSTAVKIKQLAPISSIKAMLGGQLRQQVQELFIAKSAFSSLHLNALAEQLPGVFRLALHASTFLAAGEQLPWRYVESLKVEGLSATAMQNMASIASLTSLTSLSITSSAALTDSFLQILSPLQRLKHLDLSFCCRISGVGFANLGVMPYLRRIDLEGCACLNEASFIHFQRYVALEDLNIESCRITGEGFAYLIGIQRLKSLRIGNITQLESGAFTHLAKISTLETLDLTGATIDDHALFSLRGAPSLKSVNLTGCLGLSGAAIIELCNSCPISYINLSWQVMLKDHDLAQILSCHRLKTVALYGCRGLSPRFVASLSQALYPGFVYS